VNARADLPTSFRREIGGRGLLVLFLFGLTLFLLYSANLIEVPTSGFYDPDRAMFNVAFGVALAMVCVALPQQRTRRLLAVLLASLALFLLLLDLGGMNYRFISESDEGESSMLLIGLLAGSAILWALPAFRRPDTQAEGINRPVRYSDLRQYAVRVMWATDARKTLSALLAIFYALATVVVVAGGEWDTLGASGTSDPLQVLLLAAISFGAGFLGSRASNRTLKAAFWVVSALFAIFLMLGSELGMLLMIFALHASLAFAAFAASAAAADARDSGAKAVLTLISVAMAVAWILLAFYGAIAYAMAASGYYS
jgi:hypothetical protein